MPGSVYNFQGCVSFIDILDWDHKTGQGRFGGPLPQAYSPILNRHGQTDIISMKGALRG